MYFLLFQSSNVYVGNLSYRNLRQKIIQMSLVIGFIEVKSPFKFAPDQPDCS